MNADKPIEFLRDEMESDQLAVRVNAVHRSPVIAALIGEKAVEKELVPFLECRCQSRSSDFKRRR